MNENKQTYKYLISSCLVGIDCRYNGTSTNIPELKAMVEQGKALCVCPEVLAGLPTPRESCEIQVANNKCYIKGQSGKDYTDEFETGAQKTLEIALSNHIDHAILQSRSPSCGFGKIYDGKFSGKLIAGNGVTAELLAKHEINIWTEENWNTK
ncbi:DUF523 domain-containing protein [Prolixibacteraceae bacterium JC049]|nr:DUF523 domain-containing protein [Prolixibacteraceae bacterium JC049]